MDGRPWGESIFPPHPLGLQFGHTRGSVRSGAAVTGGLKHRAPRGPPLPSHQPPGTYRQGPHARARRARVQVFPSPLRPRGPRLPILSCHRHAQAGGSRLPVEEVQDDIGHGGGELEEVELRGGIEVVALREPGSDEQQKHSGSQHPTDAHGYGTPGVGGRERLPSAAGERDGVWAVRGERELGGR